MRLLELRLLIGVFVAVSGQTGMASASSFYSQCHKLLPTADEFARECQQRARPFSRTFYPGGGARDEVESYSTYFRPLDAPSHFVLGCVLNFKHKINFAGLYYTAEPLDMSRFDEYGITFIDPNDDVGLEIGGTQHVFVPVRRFVTDLIPPPLGQSPKNCDEDAIETTKEAVATGYMRVRQMPDDIFEICRSLARDAPYCREFKYLFFIEKHQAPIVYSFNTFGIGQFFIDGEGAFMVQEKAYKDICEWKKDSAQVSNVIREMCARPERPTKGE